MKALLNPFGSFRATIGLDLRSLALFRVCLGLIIIGDVLDRCNSLKAHYTDQGITTRIDTLQHERVTYLIYIHGLNGSLFFQGILMALHVIFAVLMAVGFHTRLMTILVFFWTLSLHSHAPFVGLGGDTYCRCLMFFSIFLPLGKARGT